MPLCARNAQLTPVGRACFRTRTTLWLSCVPVAITSETERAGILERLSQRRRLGSAWQEIVQDMPIFEPDECGSGRMTTFALPLFHTNAAGLP